MALTGHRVICWDEKGEIVEPAIETSDYKVEIYKEYIAIWIKETKKCIKVCDGYVMFDSVVIAVRGEWKKILFYIEAEDKLRFGLAKHEDIGKINEADIRELALWLAFLASGVYSPGYSSWFWLLGHFKTDLIQKAVKSIKEVKKLDQGDAFFSACLDFGVPKAEWFIRPMTVLDHLLGAAEEERDAYLDKLNKYAEKIEKEEKLSKEEREEIAGMLRNYAMELVFGE